MLLELVRTSPVERLLAATDETRLDLIWNYTSHARHICQTAKIDRDSDVRGENAQSPWYWVRSHLMAAESRLERVELIGKERVSRRWAGSLWTGMMCWLEVGGGPRLELGVAVLVKVVGDGGRGHGWGGVTLFHRNVSKLLLLLLLAYTTLWNVSSVLFLCKGGSEWIWCWFSCWVLNGNLKRKSEYKTFHAKRFLLCLDLISIQIFSTWLLCRSLNSVSSTCFLSLFGENRKLSSWFASSIIWLRKSHVLWHAW